MPPHHIKAMGLLTWQTMVIAVACMRASGTQVGFIRSPEAGFLYGCTCRTLPVSLPQACVGLMAALTTPGTV